MKFNSLALRPKSLAELNFIGSLAGWLAWPGWAAWPGLAGLAWPGLAGLTVP